MWEIAAGKKPASLEVVRAFDAALAASGRLAATVMSDPGAEGDDMHRRTLLAGATVAASALLSPVPAVADGTAVAGLDDVLFQPSPVDVAPVTLLRLRAAVRAAGDDFTGVRYRQLAGRLPALIRTAEATRDAADHDARSAAEGLLSEAYGLAARLAIKLHEQGTAWEVADRAVQAARASGNPHALAVARQTASVVLRRSAHRDQAHALILTAAADLRADTDLAGGADVGLYASMLATAAYTAALADRRDEAWTLADEAAAALTPGHATGFGINDLVLYRSGIARALGDYGHAVDHAQRVRADLLASPERRARLWEDTALAWWGRGRPVQAWEALREAETVAPQEVRYRPWAQQLTTALLSVDTRQALPGLRAFAVRVGVAG